MKKIDILGRLEAIRNEPDILPALDELIQELIDDVYGMCSTCGDPLEKDDDGQFCPRCQPGQNPTTLEWEEKDD